MDKSEAKSKKNKPEPKISKEMDDIMPELKKELQKIQILIDSGMLPKHIDTPQKGFLVIQKGRELGFPPIASMEHIYPVDGKTGLDYYALGFVLEKANVTWKTLKDFQDCDTPADANMIPGFKNKETIIEFTRGNMKELGRFTLLECYKIEWKKGEKLKDKWNYKNWLTQMIWLRAHARGGRRIAPGATMGCYLVDELGGMMNDKGEVIVKDLEIKAPVMAALDKSNTEPIQFEVGKDSAEKVKVKPAKKEEPKK